MQVCASPYLDDVPTSSRHSRITSFLVGVVLGIDDLVCENGENLILLSMVNRYIFPRNASIVVSRSLEPVKASENGHCMFGNWSGIVPQSGWKFHCCTVYTVSKEALSDVHLYWRFSVSIISSPSVFCGFFHFKSIHSAFCVKECKKKPKPGYW